MQINRRLPLPRWSILRSAFVSGRADFFSPGRRESPLTRTAAGVSAGRGCTEALGCFERCGRDPVWGGF